MPDHFKIVPGPAGESAIVFRLFGQLDSSSSPLIADLCAEAGKRGVALVLDLSGIEVIVSSGIGALLAAAESMSELGPAFFLVSLSEPVDSVVRLLNLDAYLNIHSTEFEAIGSLKAA